MGTFTNIKSLRGMGIFADRGMQSPPLAFRRYNLVYGFNGSGKSTLSRLFSSLQAGEVHSKLPEGGTFEVTLGDGKVYGLPSNLTGLEQRVLVFNSDYIERNLQWAAGRAEPVFYIGAEQADAARKLTEVEGDIAKAETSREIADAYAKASAKAFATFKRDRAKDVARHLHLGGRRYEAPAFASDYETWKDDTNPKLSDDELKAAEDTCRLDEPMARLVPIEFDTVSVGAIYQEIAELCVQSLATITLDEVNRFPDILLWLKHGREFHEAHGLTDCLFCGNEISPDRRALLAAAMDDRVDRFIARLAAADERMRVLTETAVRLQTILPDTGELAAEYQAAYKAARDSVAKNAHNLVQQLEPLWKVLSSKRERPAAPADMTTIVPREAVLVAANDLNRRLEELNGLIAAHNDAASEFAERKKAAETSIRRHFVADCRDDYVKIAKEANDAAANLVAATETLADRKEAARELRHQIRAHGPAASAINKLIAAYLGHNELAINPVEEGYELHRHGTPIEGVPSEGEKTAIAISYFLSSIEADNRKLKDVIVVVDDPVSSLDSKALNFACSLVRSRLDKAAQVFVMTHNLQCMNEFRKGWKSRARPRDGKDPTATYLFIDVAIPEGQARRSSQIVEMSKLLREYDSEYHFLFSHVIRFVGQGDAYDDHGYMMPNVLRRVLDVFLAFRCPGGSGLTSQLEKLCKDHPDLDKDRLSALERLAQTESHSDNLDDLLSFSTMTLEETRDAARALLAMMEQVDPKHLKNLTRVCS
ncbi:AAA family ATPase [Albimonas sp. CAU 1670]|uniref:AAA family ATPase n=1 Tax=Albimonas sp. CAU 1670 TaxID=3032599 RepID=UPI0023DA04E6|nr:AAA family ATPase [Albimonas sp. CAU 1670]MDF2232399.1 AAA family ATPase [Albimonas sp. CAU 1670]